MSSLYGISVTNKDNHSLISSDIETLHFGGLADYLSTVTAQDNQIENYKPVVIGDAEKQQIANNAASAVASNAAAARVLNATEAAAAALSASILKDGTTVDGNITTIRSTNPDTGIVTTVTLTATTTTTNHPAITSTNPVTHVVTTITEAYTSTSTSTTSSTYVDPVSVKDAAYNANYAAGFSAYDTYIETTRADYIEYIDIQNSAALSATEFSNIGKSWIHTFSTPGVFDFAPLFFINPTNSVDSFGVLRQYYESGVWKIDVIQSGDTSRPPNILTFKRPSDIPDPAINTYGIVTHLADGKVAFDSRRGPLAILAAESIASPTVPFNGGVLPDSAGTTYVDYYAVKLDFDFRTNNRKNSKTISTTIKQKDIMFCVPALSEAVYSRLIRGAKVSKGGWFEADQQLRRVDHWWVMCHQTYSVSPGSISAGWCIYKSGYLAVTQNDKGGVSFGSLLGAVINKGSFGLSNIIGFGILQLYDIIDRFIGKAGDPTSIGFAPYKNKTINTGEQTVLIADASFYI